MTYKCNICGKEFDSYTKLGGHKGSHSRKKGMILNPKYEIFKCLNCNKDIKISKIQSNSENFKKPKYCSHNCHYEHTKLINKNKNVIMSNGDEIDITLDQYRIIKNNAKYCEICGKTFSHKLNDREISLLIDHDHKTKKFRGILCSNCNRTLGWYEKYQNNIENYLK